MTTKQELEIQYQILEKAFQDGALDCSWWEKFRRDNGFGAALTVENFNESMDEIKRQADWNLKNSDRYKFNVIPYEEGKRLWEESNPKET